MTIPEADRALHSLIGSALGDHGVTLSFDPPTSQWSQGTAGDAPTVNCYLYELAENTTLRETGVDLRPTEDRRIGESDPPPLADLGYVISVWTGQTSQDPAAEHELLSALARTVYPTRSLPPAHVPDGAWLPSGFAVPFRTVAAPAADMRGLWQSMGQPWKPALAVIMTIPLETVAERVFAPVTSVRVGFHAREEGLARIAGIVAAAGGEKQPIEGATVTLVGQDSLELGRSHTDDAGRFTLSARQDGDLVIEARATGYRTTTQRIDRLAERNREEIVIGLRKSGG